MARPLEADPVGQARARLMDEIKAGAEETRHWTGRSRFSAAVMSALQTVPRHRFLADMSIAAAYANRPQSIGHGQTISQPYMVALMSDLLDLPKAARVLEIGTGCGYQTAVLCELFEQVYSIEIIPELSRSADKRLTDLGYANYRLKIGDGFDGWPKEAPFDGIITTAAPEFVPEALTRQLRVGGKLVIPVGPVWETQHLLVIEKQPDGKLMERATLACAFVPMVRMRN